MQPIQRFQSNPPGVLLSESQQSARAAAAGVIAVVWLCLGWPGEPVAAADEPAPDARVAGLIDQLQHGQFEPRRRAADALGDIGAAAAAAVPALVEALRDEHVEVRWYALDALGRIGQAAPVAVPALVQELTNPGSNRYSRRTSARALGRFGPLAAAASEALIADLDSADLELRVEAALALWRVSRDRRGIATLSRLIDPAIDPAAFGACLAVAEIGPEAGESTAALLAALAGADADVRRAAAQALGSMGPEALQPIAQRLAQQDGEQGSTLDPGARASAADALGIIADQIRRSAFDRADSTDEQFAAAADRLQKQVIPVLAKLLKSADPVVSQHAARALAATGLLALPVLADALLSDQPPVWQAADRALEVVEQALPGRAEIRSRFRAQLQAVGPALTRALAGDRVVQQAAARAYALLPIPGTAETVERLRDVIQTDDLATRHYAALALARFENEGPTR